MADNKNIDIQQDSEKVSETMIMAAASSDGKSVGAATRKDPKKAAWFAKVGQQIVKDMQPAKSSVKK